MRSSALSLVTYPVILTTLYQLLFIVYWDPTLGATSTTSRSIGGSRRSKATGLTFPTQVFAEVSTSNRYSVLAGTLGGCESKFEVTTDSSSSSSSSSSGASSFIFKPAQRAAKATVGSYQFRPSKGGLVYVQKEHPAKILNELIAYTVDNLLELYRVPPVIAFAIETAKLRHAMTSYLGSHPWECSMDFSVADASWLRNETHVLGTLQLKIPRVTQLSTLQTLWYRYLSSSGSSTSTTTDILSERERNTRTLFDYMIGNWDRGNNNNFVYASKMLVYIDQNALREREVPFDPQLSCRFYHRMYQRLVALRNRTKVAVSDRMDRDELLDRWKSVLPKTLGPLRFINSRTGFVLDHIDSCIHRFGDAYVFQQ